MNSYGKEILMRIGQGYDVHRLVEGRKLILGGVEIPYEKGLLGHSDADVLLHAVMDALLGAAALGDIGQHFPDSDERYKGISSVELLKEVGKILQENGYLIENIDSTVIAQRPKLLPYRRSWIYRGRGRNLRPGDRAFEFGCGLRAGGPRRSDLRGLWRLPGL